MLKENEEENRLREYKSNGMECRDVGLFSFWPFFCSSSSSFFPSFLFNEYDFMLFRFDFFLLIL